MKSTKYHVFSKKQHMKKINESFPCLGCKKIVPAAAHTCRNHCPYCFVSQHVDGEIPGDRNALVSCGGCMFPAMYEIKNGGMKILFICEKCGKKHWNKRLEDDEVEHLDEYIGKYKLRVATYIDGI